MKNWKNIFSSALFAVLTAAAFAFSQTGPLSVGSGGSSFNGTLSSGQFLAPDGSGAAPSYSFTSDPTNGMYLEDVDTLGFATTGVGRWKINNFGHLTTTTDNSYDIGTALGPRPRDFHIAGRLAINRKQSVTLDAVTTFNATSSYVLLACTGVETLNTITGGLTGMELIIEHTDTECTIADDDDPTAADAINLTGAATNDVGALGKTIRLFYNGTYWLQVSESANT